jgi:hypothetical protein
MAESGRPPYAEVAFSGIKGGGASGSYNPGDLNTLTGGTVRNGTVQGHIARRATRAALSESTQT